MSMCVRELTISIRVWKDTKRTPPSIGQDRIFHEDKEPSLNCFQCTDSAPPVIETDTALLKEKELSLYGSVQFSLALLPS